MQIPPVKIVFPKEDRDEILRRIDESLATGQVAQGKNVKEFETNFAQYTGLKHAVAVANGGAALEVVMRMLGVHGHEVLVPTNTFAATATSVVMAGGTVRFVDTDAATFSVSLAALKAAATPATKGVIVVHIGGLITPEMDAIKAWCDEKGYWLVEDAAHAQGSRLHGRHAGSWGIASTFSFYSTKVITSGEGGMIATNDDSLADRARGMRDYGKPDPWVSFHKEIASNWRMSEFCAAVGVVQLRRLDEFVAARAKSAAIYAEELRSSGLEVVAPAGQPSWYKFIVLLPRGVDRTAFKAKMKAKGVSLSGGVYETPLHQQPVFAGAPGRFPVADDVCARHVCLPLFPGMTEAEARFVAETFLATIKEVAA